MIKTLVSDWPIIVSSSASFPFIHETLSDNRESLTLQLDPVVKVKDERIRLIAIP